MTWLYEDPLTVAFGGAAIAAVTVVILLQVGRMAALVGLLVVGLVTGGLLVVEHRVVTDREKVDAALHETADAALAGDIAGILQHFSTEGKTQYEKDIRRYGSGRFAQDVSLSNLVITTHQLTSPPSADADFTAVVRLKPAASFTGHRLARVKLSVQFVKQGDAWLIDGYKRLD